MDRTSSRFATGRATCCSETPLPNRSCACAGRESHRGTGNQPPGANSANSPLRFAFLGRFDPTKGTDVIVRALAGTDLPLELDLYGVKQGESGNRYSDQIRELIGGDPRIRLLPPISAGHT